MRKRRRKENEKECGRNGSANKIGRETREANCYTQDDIVAAQGGNGQIHGLGVRSDAYASGTECASRLFGTTIITLDGIGGTRDAEPMLLHERGRGETARRTAVQEEHGGNAANETSELDELALGVELVDFLDCSRCGSRGWWGRR